jgi:hypothetical protein
MRDTVARLRQLMSEAVPQTQAFVVLPPSGAGITEHTELEQSPRARSLRRILRIVEFNHWPQVLEAALDEAEVGSLASLDDEQVERLLTRLTQLEDCAILCADTQFAPMDTWLPSHY